MTLRLQLDHDRSHVAMGTGAIPINTRTRKTVYSPTKAKKTESAQNDGPLEDTLIISGRSIHGNPSKEP